MQSPSTCGATAELFDESVKIPTEVRPAATRANREILSGAQLFRGLEPWGFEPQILPCHGSVIPFHYGPGDGSANAMRGCGGVKIVRPARRQVRDSRAPAERNARTHAGAHARHARTYARRR